jgi:hypothetical protein
MAPSTVPAARGPQEGELCETKFAKRSGRGNRSLDRCAASILVEEDVVGLKSERFRALRGEHGGVARIHGHADQFELQGIAGEREVEDRPVAVRALHHAE